MTQPIRAVSPSAAAADPSHPEHDRWVKEKTLAMEAAHAREAGKTFRSAEIENERLLQRMDAIAREAPATPTVSSLAAAEAVEQKRKGHAERVAERGVVISKPKKLKKLRPNKLQLRMKKRWELIRTKARQGDQAMLALHCALFGLAIDRACGNGAFKGLTQRDADRALQRKIEDVCDRSVRLLGEWR